MICFQWRFIFSGMCWITSFGEDWQWSWRTFWKAKGFHWKWNRSSSTQYISWNNKISPSQLLIGYWRMHRNRYWIWQRVCFTWRSCFLMSPNPMGRIWSSCTPKLDKPSRHSDSSASSKTLPSEAKSNSTKNSTSTNKPYKNMPNSKTKTTFKVSNSISKLKKFNSFGTLSKVN